MTCEVIASLGELVLLQTEGVAERTTKWVDVENELLYPGNSKVADRSFKPRQLDSRGV